MLLTYGIAALGALGHVTLVQGAVASASGYSPPSASGAVTVNINIADHTTWQVRRSLQVVTSPGLLPHLILFPPLLICHRHQQSDMSGPIKGPITHPIYFSPTNMISNFTVTKFKDGSDADHWAPTGSKWVSRS